MFASQSKGFRKSETCPSSETLLDFQAGRLSHHRAESVCTHLANCEFCDAEVVLYAHYPQVEDTVEPGEIPAPLFQLAEALLKRRASDAASLNALFRIQDEPILDKV